MSVRTICIFLLSLFNIVHSKGFGPGEQDYGFVTVRPGAHMFYWLYHTTANVSDSSERPLIIWLDGGPGSSSTGNANFWYVGPLDEYLNPREETWVKKYNILFVDSPIGVGFSYVDDLKLLNKNNQDAANDLVSLMKGFFEDVPKFRTTPFYIYGVSYGGKIAVDFALTLYNEIKLGQIECNFKGVSMGNAWISPMDSTRAYADIVYEFSLIDKKQRNLIREQVGFVVDAFDDGDYFLARNEFQRTLNLINDLCDGVNLYNLIVKPRRLSTGFEGTTHPLKDEKQIARVFNLMNGPVAEALEIPENIIWSAQMIEVIINFHQEFIMPVTSSMEKLLNDTDIDVHVLNGNLDLMASTPGTLNWINKLKWGDSQQFIGAPRTTIWVNDTLEGYKQEGGRLHFYWLNRAGHFSFNENYPGTWAFLESVTGVR